MCTLSIIIPVYNKDLYLFDCLLSIQNQQFSDYELILVNDGSTDNSAAICRDFAAQDKRIMLIEQSNGGVSSARNTGLTYATGKYIGFIDADDSIHPSMYKQLIENITLYDADISICRMTTIFENKKIEVAEDDEILLFDHTSGLKNCLKGSFDRSANNKIYTAEIAKSIRFEGSINEDILYTCKAFMLASSTVSVNRKMYNYLVRPNSASMSKFSLKYMQTVNISAQMVRMIAAEEPQCLNEVKEFDITSNLSLLNLLLLAGKNQYVGEYDQVVKRLETYRSFIDMENMVRKKHKYAYKLFSLSPSFYAKAMYVYCLITKSEAVKRSKK